MRYLPAYIIFSIVDWKYAKKQLNLHRCGLEYIMIANFEAHLWYVACIIGEDSCKKNTLQKEKKYL